MKKEKQSLQLMNNNKGIEMSFSQKLAAIIAVLVIVATTIAWLGINGASQMNDKINKIVDIDSEKVKLAARIQQNLLEMHRAEKNMILAITAEDMAEYEKNYVDAEKEMNERRVQLRNLVDEANKTILDDFAASVDAFKKVSDEVQRLTKENSNQKATQLLGTQARDRLVLVDKLTDELREAIKKDINDELAKPRTDAAVVKRKLKAMELIGLVETDMLKSVRDTGRAVLLLTDTEIKEMADRSNMFLDKLYKDIEELREVTEANRHNMIDEMLGAVKKYDEVQSEVLNLTIRNSNQKAIDLSSGIGRQNLATARDKVFNIAKINDEAMDQAKIQSDKDYADLRMMNITVSIVGIVLAILIAFFMVRQMMKMITNAINDVNEGAEQVASAAGQISDSSQQLAGGAQEQAASVEEVTSSLAETKATVDQNAENAREADMLSKDANESAKMGYEHIRELTTSMEEINESSRKIANIIKTIDEIAFQTNLLALNAAVEAARAGEHGLGFAVVAEEVRNLAQRSAEAAKDTAQIIEQSIEQVRKGNEITTETNKAFEDILEKVKKTGDITGEIAMASKEQAQGVQQIAEAMNQVDQVTQTMASNSEESAAASEEMSAQAVQMKNAIADVAKIFGINVSESTNQIKSVIHHKTTTVQPKKVVVKSTTAMKPQANNKPSDIMPLDEDDIKEF